METALNLPSAAPHALGKNSYHGLQKQLEMILDFCSPHGSAVTFCSLGISASWIQFGAAERDGFLTRINQCTPSCGRLQRQSANLLEAHSRDFCNCNFRSSCCCCTTDLQQISHTACAQRNTSHRVAQQQSTAQLSILASARFLAIACALWTMTHGLWLVAVNFWKYPLLPTRQPNLLPHHSGSVTRHGGVR